MGPAAAVVGEGVAVARREEEDDVVSEADMAGKCPQGRVAQGRVPSDYEGKH